MKALHTPCHTQDSICYLFEDGNDKAVFTGDTLFIGGKIVIDEWHVHATDAFITGCGRFFEGNAEEMDKALNQTLASLPDDTKVYVRFYVNKTDFYRDDLTAISAWSRVHQGQRQIWYQSHAIRADQEARVLRFCKQADARQIHHRRREGMFTEHYVATARIALTDLANSNTMSS